MAKRILITLLIVLLSVSAYAGSQQTSSTLASTIITNVRYILNEATASTWSDAELLVWVNLGARDIVARTKCLESTESVTVLVNTAEYSITGPYMDLITVLYTDINGVERGLIRKNPQSIGHMRGKGVPRYWYEWAGSVGIYPTLSQIPDAGLAIGSTKTNVSSIALTYSIEGTSHTIAAVAAGTAPGDDVVPKSTYGVCAFDIGADETIDAVEAQNNAVGYASVALAVADLPQVEKDHVRLGYVSATKSDGAFTFGTTNLDASNTTVTYVDSTPTLTVYFTSTPDDVESTSAVTVPVLYNRALILYTAAQAFLKTGQFGKYGHLMAEYATELDRYRKDYVDRPQEPESSIKMVP